MQFRNDLEKNAFYHTIDYSVLDFSASQTQG